MVELASFGDPSRFEVAVRWTRDSEPRSRRPALHGWSIGDLRITIANQVVTRNRRGGAHQSHVSWYLSPIFDWLTTNWAELLHEEDFAWPEKTGAPAVVACHRALDRLISVTDDAGRQDYRAVQAWYRRHALRNASEGGLFPDLFLRRFIDDIELSWSAAAPLFAPDGFVFVAEPGFARLPVADVAEPLWEALQWAASEPPQLDEADKEAWRALSEKIDQLRKLGSGELEGAYIDRGLLEKARSALQRAGHAELIRDVVRPDHPYISELSPAVAMFGGVSPNLGQQDVDYLCSLMVQKSDGHDSETLAALVEERKLAPMGLPHSDGYNLANELMEGLHLPGDFDWINIREVVEQLGIAVIEKWFETNTIRGVALAGTNIDATIVINLTSVFNSNEFGKRFTIAHEFCHVLFDRTRARRVTHVSGAWVAPAIERRANAFAAFLLMPRALVLQHWSSGARQRETIEDIARKLHVNGTALAEHLYNLDLIDDLEREHLRMQFRYN